MLLKASGAYLGVPTNPVVDLVGGGAVVHRVLSRLRLPFRAE